MPGHGHRVFIDVPRSRTPPRSPRIQVVTRTTTSPHRTHFRRHSLVLDELPSLSSTTSSGGLFFRDDPTLAGAMLPDREHQSHSLRVANDSLLRHNASLKAQVQIKDQTIQELHIRCEQLELDNLDLRRSLDSSSTSNSDVEAQLRNSRKKNVRLEAENETLRTRVRELLRMVKDATDDRVRLLKAEVGRLNGENGVLDRQASEWRRRYDDAERRLTRLRENLDDYVEDNAKLSAENERLKREKELSEREGGLGLGSRRRRR